MRDGRNCNKDANVSLTKHTLLTLALATCCAPTTALSDWGSIIYESDVALVMLDPQTAGFDCAFNDLPAKVTITQDTLATVVVKFPEALLGSAITPTVTVRRGGNPREEPLVGTSVGFQAALVDDDDPFEPIESPDDWDLHVTGEMKFCVGPATLRYVAGNVAVSAQFGEYDMNQQTVNGQVASTYASFLDDRLRVVPRYQNKAEQRFKDIGSDARLTGRSLGLYSFTHNIRSVVFVHEGTGPDLDYRVKISVKLFLVDQQQN